MNTKMKASAKADNHAESPFFLGRLEHTDGRVTFQEFVTHGEARRLANRDTTVLKIYKPLSDQEEVIIFSRE